MKYKISDLLLRLSLLLGIISLGGSCSMSYQGGSLEEYQTRKREIRGAWLPTIFRSEYMGLSRAEGRKVLGDRIALLHRMGCNVVIFQVRAEADAWYRSNYEPWSRFFSGEQGKEPYESWDPLAFVIEECHRRGMELHAWVNPYRGASNSKLVLSEDHPAKKHPEWFVHYNNQLVLDPGLPDARKYILKVLEDLVSRYDFDALHLDDYFYPYPAGRKDFPDEETFSSYALPAGYRPENKAMWRRNNVSILIYSIRQMLLNTKPWLRFGISPFGIYRNISTDPKGSKTKGLQCYDDLYADVLHWANEGWIDYIAPQIYWNIGYQVADYEILVNWWRKSLKNKKVQLYVGQDVKRTQDASQLKLKLLLSRSQTQGNLFWPGDELVRNYKDIAEELRTTYQSTPALLPEYKAPLGKTKAPRKLSIVWEDRNEDGHLIMWNDERINSDPETAYFYVVYGFPQGEKADIKRSKYILSISNRPYYKLPIIDGRSEYTLLVTAVNRFWQESKPYKLKVKI